MEEIVERVLLVAAVKVDVDGQLEFAVAVLFDAEGRRSDHSSRIVEGRMQIEDYFLHEFVEQLLVFARAYEYVPFVCVGVDAFFEVPCFVSDLDCYMNSLF